MIKKKEGFTLIELLITMTIFIIAIAATARLFITAVSQFKQQSKITETYIEGIVGLALLRQDIHNAGYGLPWNLDMDSNGSNDVIYAEAINSGFTVLHDDTLLNDAPTNVPRAFASLNNAGLNGSDVLSIKAINVGMNDTSQRSTRLVMGDSINDSVIRGLSGDNFSNADRIVIISPGSIDSNRRMLVGLPVGSANFSNITYNIAPIPGDETGQYIIYGVDPDTNLRMPFNRADYYVRTPAADFPDRCAPGTGVLYKATVNHSNGNLREYPILDCVADMQVIYILDMDDNEEIGTYSDADGTTVTSTEGVVSATVTLSNASNLRNRLKEVRVYILAQEGQMDTRYTFPDATVTVGDAALGQVFDFAGHGIANYMNFRWKVYTLSIKPINLKY